VVQHCPEAVKTNLALADMPVAIDMGAVVTQTIVQMHSFQSLQSDDSVDLPGKGVHGSLCPDIIPCGKTVTGIVADADVG
jgi:hypothetical protein